jgi:hypothetical protein
MCAHHREMDAGFIGFSETDVSFSWKCSEMLVQWVWELMVPVQVQPTHSIVHGTCCYYILYYDKFAMLQYTTWHRLCLMCFAAAMLRCYAILYKTVVLMHCCLQFDNVCAR